VTCSSISRLGRTKIAAVRALWVDDREHHALAALPRVLVGCGDDGGGAGVVDDPACPD
jgi:hypothetical protein